MNKKPKDLILAYLWSFTFDLLFVNGMFFFGAILGMVFPPSEIEIEELPTAPVCATVEDINSSYGITIDE